MGRHPGSAAIPSETDIRDANDPEFVHVIVSLAGATPQVAAFQIRDGAAIEVLLGAESLDDLLSRLDAVDRVSEQDVRVLRAAGELSAQRSDRSRSCRSHATPAGVSAQRNSAKPPGSGANGSR